MSEKFTQLYLPKGEWLDATLTAFKRANLELEAPLRCYEYRFTKSRIPIVFQAIRSKEVWSDIIDPETEVNGGFTGSDIVLEQEIKPNRRYDFPLYDLEPENGNFPRPKIYLGSTPNFRSQITNPNIEELEGKTVYTAYPNITKNFFEQKKIKPNIVEKQGTIEGRWRTNLNNWAIVDVASSEKTLKANQIEIMENIFSARLQYVEGPNISTQDQSRIDYLMETIEKSK
jgi:ATP phosphoribosyltransferase